MRGLTNIVTAFLALNPGKAILQNAAVKIAVNDLLDIGAKEPVLPFEPLVKNQWECFEIVFHALVVGRVLWITMAVYDSGMSFFCSRKQNRIPTQKMCRIEQLG